MDQIWSPYWFWESTIPPFICDEIIHAYKTQRKFSQGVILKDTIDQALRKSDVIFSDEHWINAMLYGYVNSANYSNFNYELSNFDKEPFQFTRYRKGEYYHLHRDFCPAVNSEYHTRKLSATLQLSDSDDYEGGDLLIAMHAYDDDFTDRDKQHTMNRCKGSIIVFDSRVPHQVTPVTKGIRYSLVKWVHGDKPLR